MRILAVGDIHGRNVFNKIHFEKYDKVIFLGDYCDSHSCEVTGEEIYEIFVEVIRLKKEMPEKIELLLGNHDLQYYFYRTDYFNKVYFGQFDFATADMFSEMFKKEKRLFKAAYQIGNFLFTHAGLTKKMREEFAEIPMKKLASTLNKKFLTKKKIDCRLLWMGKNRCGFEPTGSIFWADIRDFAEGIPEDLWQIVGHNQVKEITLFTSDDGGNVTFCDCLTYKTDFFSLTVKGDEVNAA